MAIIIETNDLKKVYGSKGVSFVALDGIDLRVQKGEFLGIMGPSGAGKTTLLNLISTIDRPSSGKIIFEGRDLGEINDRELSKLRRNSIGFIFQDFNLLDNMTVEDNIALPLALEKKNHRDILNKVEEISRFFGINKHLKKYPYQLSGGQKQRAAAARALITSPSVIFADEPTGALDSKSSSELLQSMLKMNEKYDTTVMLVTHDAFAASYCKRILFLKDGRIHAKLDKNESRKEFFHRILDLLAAFGGGSHEFV